MNKKSTWIALIAIIIILIAGVWYFQKPEPASGEAIKVGFIGALSGDAAFYGELMKNGISIAIEEINQEGGIDGKPIEVVYEDGKCNGQDATSAAQKLVSVDKVNYIVGMVCSGEVLGASPITEQNKVVILVQGSSPDISEAGDSIFRTWPSDTESGRILAEHAAENFKSVSIITEKTEYAVDLESVFTEEYKKTGQVITNESFSPGTTDFRSILAKVKTTNPEAVFINTQTGPTAAILAKQARDLGITSQFYTSFFSGDDFIKANSAVEGTILVDTPVLDENNSKAKKFLEKYRIAYGQDPSYSFMSGSSYDQMNLLAQSLRKVGDDKEKVKDYLYSLGSYSGTIGKFNFDSKGDVEGVELTLKKVENGELILVK